MGFTNFCDATVSQNFLLACKEEKQVRRSSFDYSESSLQVEESSATLSLFKKLNNAIQNETSTKNATI